MFTKYAVVVLIVLNVYGHGSATASDPDAIALLRGVYQSRALVKGRCSLDFQRLSKDDQGITQSNSTKSNVEFDGIKARFVSEINDFRLSKGISQEMFDGKIRALKFDMAAAEAAGLGKRTKETIYMTFDGHQLAEYSANGGAYIREQVKGSIWLFFDVRTLGICRSHSPVYSLEECLALRGEFKAKNLGIEKINMINCWHVEMISSHDVALHYWIEESADGFRVHQYEFRHPVASAKSIMLTMKSYYEVADGSNQRPLLPSKVVVDEKNEKRTETVTFSLKNFDLTFRPDNGIFGLAGLNMPIGEMVTDDRLLHVIGIWNGNGLSQNIKDAFAIHAASQSSMYDYSWLWIVGAGVVAAILVYRFCMSRNKS